MRASLDHRESPASITELVERAERLAGHTIGELAAAVACAMPSDPKRAKGYIGQLIEQVLGAMSRSRAEPDFPQLGVELKTIPMRPDGRPVESTFVCTIPLLDVSEVPWSESRVKRKLSRVLFVPIEAGKHLSLASRRVGRPNLWTPTPQQEALLRDDWEELAGIIATGGAEIITAHLGRCLQVRPKAANAAVRTRAPAPDSAFMLVNPRGFYLRRTFTAHILRGDMHPLSTR